MGRNALEQDLHDMVIPAIAADRFGIVDWSVCTNLGDGNESEPDIIATVEGKVVASGEVETASTLSDDEAAEWKAFGDRCPRFYLFVPEGAQETAIDLIEKHKVVCAGLRCYSSSEDGLSISSVDFPNGRCREDIHPWWINLGKE